MSKENILNANPSNRSHGDSPADIESALSEVGIPLTQDRFALLAKKFAERANKATLSCNYSEEYFFCLLSIMFMNVTAEMISQVYSASLAWLKMSIGKSQYCGLQELERLRYLRVLIGLACQEGHLLLPPIILHDMWKLHLWMDIDYPEREADEQSILKEWRTRPHLAVCVLMAQKMRREEFDYALTMAQDPLAQSGEEVPTVALLRARALMRMKRHEEAMALYHEIISCQDNAGGMVRLAADRELEKACLEMTG